MEHLDAGGDTLSLSMSERWNGASIVGGISSGASGLSSYPGDFTAEAPTKNVYLLHDLTQEQMELTFNLVPTGNSGDHLATALPLRLKS